MRESVFYQMILQEGEVIGRTKEAKKFLLLVGENRFGAPSARQAAALEAITDLGRLEQMWRRILEADSWEDLLGAPARHPPRSRRRRNS